MFAQSLIVLRPVSYLLFRFTHVTTALIITKDQITGLGKVSTDLGDNAQYHRDTQSTNNQLLNYLTIDCYSVNCVTKIKTFNKLLNL
jgi:hypothetical protein